MQIKRVVSLGLYTKECVTHNYPRLLSTAEEKHCATPTKKKRHKQSHTQTTFIVSILILLYKRVL